MRVRSLAITTAIASTVIVTGVLAQSVSNETAGSRYLPEYTTLFGKFVVSKNFYESERPGKAQPDQAPRADPRVSGQARYAVSRGYVKTPVYRQDTCQSFGGNGLPVQVCW
jgi:hypothetical protein